MRLWKAEQESMPKKNWCVLNAATIAEKKPQLLSCCKDFMKFAFETVPGNAVAGIVCVAHPTNFRYATTKKNRRS